MTKTQRSVGKPARITKNKTESLLLSRFSTSSVFKDWKFKMVKKGMQYSWVFLLWKTWAKRMENAKLECKGSETGSVQTVTAASHQAVYT